MNIENDINNLTSTTEYEPIKAIIVYEREMMDHYDRECRQNYIEIRDIKNGIMQAAKPASLSFITKIAEYIKRDIKKGKFKLSGAIPKNLIYLNNNIESTLVWFCKGEKRKLYFSGTKLKTDEYPTPHTIFVFCPDSLNLFIFCTNSILLSSETELLYAPYYNTKTSVCNGSIFNNIKDFESIEDIVKNVTNIYFNSYFTEEHDTFYKGRNNKSTIWRKAKKQKSFPYKLLRPTKLKLKDLYEQIQDQSLLSST